MLDFVVIPLSWRIILWLLLMGVVVLNIGGFLFNRYDPQQAGRMKSATKLPQTALLIGVAAIVWLNGASGTQFQSLALCVLCGISFGFVGDLFMANVFKQKDHVLFGMAAFAIGHILYMLGFRELVLLFRLTRQDFFLPALIIMWVIGVILWAVLVRKPGGDSMQYAALGYGLFLSSMAGYALGIVTQQPAFIPLIVGSTLFVISDTLIAAQLFAGRSFRYMGDTIWITYIAAQILIVITVPLAIALLKS